MTKHLPKWASEILGNDFIIEDDGCFYPGERRIPFLFDILSKTEFSFFVDDAQHDSMESQLVAEFLGWV